MTDVAVPRVLSKFIYAMLSKVPAWHRYMYDYVEIRPDSGNFA